MNSYVNNLSSIRIKDEQIEDDSYYCFFKRKKKVEVVKSTNSMNYSLLNRNIINLEQLSEVQLMMDNYPERQAIQNSSPVKSVNLDKYPIILTYNKESFQSQLVDTEQLTLMLTYPEYKVDHSELLIHGKLVECIEYKDHSPADQIYYVGIVQRINTNLCDHIIVIPFSPNMQMIDPIFNELKLEFRQALFNLLIPFAGVLDKLTIILPSIVPLHNILSIAELLISLSIKIRPSFYPSLVVNCVQQNSRYEEFVQYKITFDIKCYGDQINQLLKSRLNTDLQIELLPVQFINALLWSHKPLLQQQFIQYTQISSVSPTRKSDSPNLTSPITPMYNYESNLKFELEASDLKKDKESY